MVFQIELLVEGLHGLLLSVYRFEQRVLLVTMYILRRKFGLGKLEGCQKIHEFEGIGIFFWKLLL